MWNRVVVLLLVGVLSGHTVARADERVAREMPSDVVLRALVDELERSATGLQLEGFERPYLIQYLLTDFGTAQVSAVLGAVTGRNQYRGRSLETDVRVGSYELDNSNFGGGTDVSSGMTRVAVPIEDDYRAIRQAIWWMTDRDYKGVVEQLARKKAFMESKLIREKPDDLCRVPPVVYFEERVATTVDPAPLERLTAALSEAFRAYPEVQSATAWASLYAGNQYLVNTEGMRLRQTSRRCAVVVRATVQAEDGMSLTGSFSAYGHTLDELPPLDELVARCRTLAAQLVAVRGAPLLESYTGPVLFEAEPATHVFARFFGESFGGGQRAVGSPADPEDFANKLNKRILPRFMDVRDDPSLAVIEGIPVLGHYAYDEQGVAAQAVTLVEDGRLRALLMSRNPSKEFPMSNGHGRGSAAADRGDIGCLVVTADPPTDSAGLRQKLIELCADEDLEYGIRIAALGTVGAAGPGVRSSGDAGASPLLIYKVYPDGREELVRGAEISRIDLKAFKQIVAAGDRPFVRNTASGFQGSTVAVPALLFRELDLAKMDRDFDKPPVLPSPLQRQAQH